MQLSNCNYLGIYSKPSLPFLLFKQRSVLLFFELRVLLIVTYTDHRSQSPWPCRSQNMSSCSDELSVVSKESVGNTALERNVGRLFLLPLFIHSFFPHIASFQFQDMCRLEIASAPEDFPLQFTWTFIPQFRVSVPSFSEEHLLPLLHPARLPHSGDQASSGEGYSQSGKTKSEQPPCLSASKQM